MSLHAGLITPTTPTTSFIIGVVTATVFGTAILGIAAFIVVSKHRGKKGLKETDRDSEKIGAEAAIAEVTITV